MHHDSISYHNVHSCKQLLQIFEIHVFKRLLIDWKQSLTQLQLNYSSFSCCFFAFWDSLQFHQSKTLFRGLPLHRKFNPKQKASSNTERFQEIEDLQKSSNQSDNPTFRQFHWTPQLQVCQKNDDIHDPNRIPTHSHSHSSNGFPIGLPKHFFKTPKKTFLTYRRIPIGYRTIRGCRTFLTFSYLVTLSVYPLCHPGLDFGISQDSGI